MAKAATKFINVIPKLLRNDANTKYVINVSSKHKIDKEMHTLLKICSKGGSLLGLDRDGSKVVTSPVN